MIALMAQYVGLDTRIVRTQFHGCIIGSMLEARLDMVSDAIFQFNTMYNVTGYLQFSTTVTAVLL